MLNETNHRAGASQAGPSAPTPLASVPRPRVCATWFSSTPRGARLARHLAGNRLEEWGIAYGSTAHDTTCLLVSEPFTNAVRHGEVPGRDFELSLRYGITADRQRRLCVAATDHLEIGRPAAQHVDSHTAPDPLPEYGRGLVLVAELADRWGWHVCALGPGKTVWAEIHLPGPYETAPPRTS